MCAIVGLSATDNVSLGIYEALLVLQHRGQDSSGIATESNGRMYQRKKHGLVDRVFRKPAHLEQLPGHRGIGHVRYPTAGGLNKSEVQPFFVNSPYGICLTHNGNLTNTKALKKYLRVNGRRHINTDADSEILINVFAEALKKASSGDKLRPEDIFSAVSEVQSLCLGAYSVVIMIIGYGILAFRDRLGIRPLVYGSKVEGTKSAHIFASESVAVDALNFNLVGDVEPGEAIYVDNDQQVFRKQCVKHSSLTPCVFEYVYLSRPDSIINGVSVYQARRNMGNHLGNKILSQWPDHDIDIVVGVPDTSRIAASELAIVLGVPYREALIKNRYIGRTFIMPNQSARKKSIKRKLNAISLEFSGRNVLLVDDSIVRGNTSRAIVRMAREAGAKKVYFASAAPPVCYQNVYGIDVPSKEELLTGNQSLEEAEAFIGCDRLFYQDIESLEKSVKSENVNIKHMENSVFTGKYITGDIDSHYLAQLELTRNDKRKNDMCLEREAANN